MSSERRKDYMVSRRVQGLYFLIWGACLLLVASLVWMAIKLKGVATQVQDEQNVFIIVGALAFVIVLSALLLAVGTIIHTHRVMGSAYRIDQVLKEILAGKSTRITLRDGDFFLEIAEGINRLAEGGVEPLPSAVAGVEATGGEEGEGSEGESDPAKVAGDLATGEGEGDLDN